ncbi:MAG: gliding motility protein GldC [Saprospiraceae bacterium]|nr:gliding motility protein GldC [Saprospiraceae bacterium]MBK8632948.1 gliding motility protein GldC [Saprospiraceae bacterium]
MSKNTITIEVELDDQNMPENIKWTAEKDGVAQPSDCKGMFLSFFDKDYKDTYRLDLWTKDMQVTEMNMFIYHTINGIADSYFRATQDNKSASAIKQLAQYLADENELFPKSE